MFRERAGAKDLGQTIRERVVKIVKTHRVPELPGKVLEEIKRIKTRGEGELIEND